MPPLPSRRLAPAAAVLCLALLVTVTPPPAGAGEGDPDPSFGTNGVAYAELEGIDLAWGPLVAQSPDGRLVVAGVQRAGTGPWSVGFLRFSAAGARDAGFGNPSVAAVEPAMHALRVLPDGRIVAAFFDNGDLSILRRTAAGDPDTTYDGDGRAVVDSPCGLDAPIDSAIGDDGRVVIAWYCGAEENSVIHAIDGSGQADAGYGEQELAAPTGVTTTPRVLDVELDPTGRVLALATVFENGHAALVYRRTIGGPPDTTFDGDGVRRIPDRPVRLAVDAAGRPIVAIDQATLAFQRLTAAGGIDAGFGFDGRIYIVEEDLCCFDSVAMTVMPGNRVVAVAAHDDPARPNSVLAVFRLTEQGFLDDTFGGGFQTFELGPDARLVGHGTPIAQAADGKIVIPLAVAREGVRRTVTLNAPARYAVALARLGEGVAPTPEEPRPEPEPEQRPAPATLTPILVAPALPVVTVPRAPSARRCASRRRFPIRLRTGRPRRERSPIVSATVLVDGKRVSTKRTGATVDLRSVPAGRFTVTIRLRLADGGIVRERRTYRTCTRKIAGTLKPLRTRAPKRRPR